VVVVRGKIGLPQPGQPTTHILKPPIERFRATTENEAFAMRLFDCRVVSEPGYHRNPGRI
jgi:hypothetical protein